MVKRQSRRRPPDVDRQPEVLSSGRRLVLPFRGYVREDAQLYSVVSSVVYVSSVIYVSIVRSVRLPRRPAGQYFPFVCFDTASSPIFRHENPPILP